MRRTQELLKQVGGAEVLGVKLPPMVEAHWKTILTRTLEDLVEHQEGLLVFCWDELPMMLDNMKRDHGEPMVMEVLDTLRSLRQMLPNLRMVFTGSIGLHHVLARLKETGYANAPTNDMYTEDVAPLALADACDLVTRLLCGEQIEVEPALVEAIATSVDCFPYYIHHVVDALKWSTATRTAAQVNAIVQASLCDDADRWDLAHYRDRINTYYAGADQKLALAILDELAATETSLSLRDLMDRLAVQGVISESEVVWKVLMLLRRDHYVEQGTDGTYRFKFRLIQRYWRFRF
jgi:hypothetical protein